MSRVPFIGIVSLAAALVTTHVSTAQPTWQANELAEAKPAYDPERVLVRFRSLTRADQRQNAHVRAGAIVTLREYGAVPGLMVVRVPTGQVAQAVTAYKSHAAVLYAEPDYEAYPAAIPNDPNFPIQWGLHNTGQIIKASPGTPDADIDAPEAWDIWTGDPDFRIAVIDTGINYNHPDLAANIWTNPGEIPGNEIDDDGNGYVDDVHGYNFRDNNGDPLDDDGHGSHSAGIIGAITSNGIGIAGINWHCSIVALKADWSNSYLINAVQYCIDNGIKLSNNSYLYSGYTQAGYDMIQAAQAVGHVFVVAAGNGARYLDDSPNYPRGFDLLNIISVGATNNDDDLAGFSNWGAVTVDLGAPGVDIYSTRLGSSYAYGSGTSFATPHVVGVAGLVGSRFPNLAWQSVRGAILDTVRPVDSLDGITATGGVVNAANVLTRLTADCNSNGAADGDDIAAGSSGDCNYNGMPDECEWTDCNGNGIFDGCDIADSTSEDCNGNSVPDMCEYADCNANGVFDGCDIAGSTSTDCNGNETPDDCDILGGTSNDVSTDGMPDECDPKTIYVDGTCGNDAWTGESDNCTARSGAGPKATIRAAVRTARAGDTVTVADGTYSGPDNTKIYLTDKGIRLQSANGPDNCVIDGGGIDRFLSIRGASNATVLSGFTIANGLTSGGSGISTVRGRPTITACVFRNNEAPVGGAVYCLVSEYVTFNDCLFHNNRAKESTGATGWGGALVLNEAQALMENCTFVGNRADQGGGAISNGGGSVLDLVDCTFVDNLAHWAGAIWNGSSPSNMTNCQFVGNRAAWVSSLIGLGGYGGAISSAWAASDIELYNCLLAGNTARYAGGVDVAAYSSATFVNSTVAHNKADFDGGGVFNEDRIGPVQCVMRNSIAWGNTPGQIVTQPNSTATVSYSCLQGGHAGPGNIGSTPQFVSGPSGSWTTNAVHDVMTSQTTLTDNTASWVADELVGKLLNPSTSQYRQSLIVSNTQDEVVVWGDFASLGATGVTYQINEYRLSPGSPTIDSADNSAVPADSADLDGDGNLLEPIPFDLDGHVRFHEDPAAPDTGAGTPPIVDMGAFEFHPGDLDGDGDADPDDYVIFANCIGGPSISVPPTGCTLRQFDLSDLGDDADVDLGDFAYIQLVLSP